MLSWVRLPSLAESCAMKATVTSVWVLGTALALAACSKSQGNDASQSATTEKAAAEKAPAAAAEAPPSAVKPSAAAEAPSLDEAKKLLGELLKPGTDNVTFTQKLKPTDADYKAVFTDPADAEKAKQHYAPMWEGKGGIGPKEGQTELKVWKATGAELAAGTGDADSFPGGYKKVANKLNPKLTYFRFKFVKPGEDLGMAFDGLVHVNGHWAFLPKPWKAVQ